MFLNLPITVTRGIVPDLMCKNNPCDGVRSKFSLLFSSDILRLKLFTVANLA